MSDIRTGLGHMTGIAKAPLKGADDPQPASDAGDGASRSGRRQATDPSPPPDGKPVSERRVEVVSGAAGSDTPGSAAAPAKTTGGEYVGLYGAGMEMRSAEHLPAGRLAQVMHDHVSLESTGWKNTVSQLALNVKDVSPRVVGEAFRGTAHGLESRGPSTPDLLVSRFAFVMKELLDTHSPTEAILAAVTGWHDGIVSQRSNTIDLKALVALRKSLQQGLERAIKDNWSAIERLPEVKQAVLQRLMAPHQVVIDEMIVLLRDRSNAADIDARLIKGLIGDYKPVEGRAAPVQWVTSLLQCIGAASDEIDRASQGRAVHGMVSVLQAVFTLMTDLTDRNAHVVPLVSALKVGMPAGTALLGWMRAHEGTLSGPERVDLAMSVLVQHDALGLKRAALGDALEGIFYALQHPATDRRAEAALGADDATAKIFAKWFRQWTDEPADTKVAQPDKSLRQVVQDVVDKFLPVFSPDHASTRKALLHALYEPLKNR